MSDILVVEDNEDLLDDLLLNLTHYGLSVSGVKDAKAMDVLLLEVCPEIVILDIGLPGEDGLSIAQRLRERFPTIGIIMLTARASLDDRILGHQTGADHYLIKPVNYQELAVVIQVLRRRMRFSGTSDVQRTPTPSWKLNKQKMTIQAPGKLDDSVPLTWAECNLLLVFIHSPDLIASKEALILGLGGKPEYFDNRRLEASVSRLRRKLMQMSPQAADQEVIKSLRNVGYQFVHPLVLEMADNPLS